MVKCRFKDKVSGYLLVKIKGRSVCVEKVTLRLQKIVPVLLS